MKNLIALAGMLVATMSAADRAPAPAATACTTATAACTEWVKGATRRARGEAFVKYVNEQLGAKHTVMIVPECGHNDRCIFTTDAVFPLIFPK